MSLSSSSIDSVACPNCSRTFSYSKLNDHLDQCLDIRLQEEKQKKRTLNYENDDKDKVTLSKKQKADARPSSSRDRLERVAPLAERLRPRTLDDFVGQDAVINGPLKALLARGIVPSAILWGPPGTGKTTLARILARTSVLSTSLGAGTAANKYRFVEISATTASTTDVKKIFDESTSRLQLTGQRTILFIDEIQRFSRAQQDVFLPVIEKGLCILIAATTENPSFRLQGALLSRMRVFVLTKLSVDECFKVLERAKARVIDEEKHAADIDDAMLRWIAEMADGDARTALGALEIALATFDETLAEAATSSSSPEDRLAEDRLKHLKQVLKRTALQYDRTGDQHYDTISALHKSIRGSNADAALYWLARMVESGDDPLFVARRLIVAASEDCNTLEALQMATATYQACQVVGLPECAETLAQCVVFLAESPKSTRAYRGWKKAQALVQNEYNYPVPIHIRNAPTKLMREMGNGRTYRYEPSFAHPVVQEFFPPELQGKRLLSPPPSAFNDETPSTLHSDKQTMPKANGIGPGACQRIFQIGARSVDLNLLDEWERERNNGRPWSGRDQLMQMLEEQHENAQLNASNE